MQTNETILKRVFKDHAKLMKKIEKENKLAAKSAQRKVLKNVKN